MPDTDTCQYVTLRAEDGDCATCGHVERAHTVQRINSIPTDWCLLCGKKVKSWSDETPEHPFLGAVLEVCGHAEDEHEDVTAG